MIAAFDYHNIHHYDKLHWAIALVIIGICFFILGWLISYFMRVKETRVMEESRMLKKIILSELNIAKKFNSDHQLQARKDFASVNGKKSSE